MFYMLMIDSCIAIEMSVDQTFFLTGVTEFLQIYLLPITQNPWRNIRGVHIHFVLPDRNIHVYIVCYVCELQLLPEDFGSNAYSVPHGNISTDKTCLWWHKLSCV